MRVFGIKASVQIKYSGELRELGNKLSQCLYLSDFHFDTDQDPPHKEFGSCEALGTEIWLKDLEDTQGFNFIIELESENCLEESFNNQMHDISPWLSKYISEICNLECKIKIERLEF